jgi:hypothetical protein
MYEWADLIADRMPEFMRFSIGKSEIAFIRRLSVYFETEIKIS